MALPSHRAEDRGCVWGWLRQGVVELPVDNGRGKKGEASGHEVSTVPAGRGGRSSGAAVGVEAGVFDGALRV